MADQFFRSGVAGIDRANIDAGLRAHMQSVFNYMGGGLALTGLIAFLVANTPLAGVIFGTPLKWVAMLAPLVFVMYMNVKMQSLSASTLKTLFWCFCAAMGLSMAAIFRVFTGAASIARAFFITGATFGAMSLWGYTTKKDLTSMGAFLLMGLLGLLIASVVNMFLASSGLQWIVSIKNVALRSLPALPPIKFKLLSRPMPKARERKLTINWPSSALSGFISISSMLSSTYWN